MAQLAPVAANGATFDANGRAVATLHGPPPGRVWTVTGLNVQTTSLTETVCRVYKNAEGPAGLVAQTRTGNADTAGGSPITMHAGEMLVFVWEGGTPGATAFANAFVTDAPV